MKYLGITVLLVLLLIVLSQPAKSQDQNPELLPPELLFEVPEELQMLPFGASCERAGMFRAMMEAYQYKRGVAGITHLNIGKEKPLFTIAEFWVNPYKDYIQTLSFVYEDGKDYTCTVVSGYGLQTDDLDAFFGEGIDH